MADSSQSSFDSVLGKLVVEKGLATRDEVQRCLDQQRVQLQGEAVNEGSLADLLIAHEMVTRRQLERLRPEIEERKKRQIPGYQLLEQLGAGAMATVYLAKQLSLDRLVAIKILPRKFTQKPEFVERFYQEGRAAAKLNHPNIVHALDVGNTGETHYFVMEYVKGRTVFEEIERRGRYTEREAIQIALQVARALEHAHSVGLIHRDVKPKNIMITEEGRAKLADMGLARAVSDREAAEAEAGKAFGTPYYISPEQIRGEIDVDFRADIYSLGATLYHMVTGQVPFDGPNPSSVMHKHLKQQVEPPDHINPELSRGISEIIEVCMAKDREQRYSTTSDLIEDLEAVARGDPPLQARKKFDILSLQSLDKRNDTADLIEIHDEPVAGTPLFWLAVVGWVLSLLLIVALFIVATR